MFICPNCTNLLERNSIFDRIIHCSKCGNDWIGVPKRTKYDLFEMINDDNSPGAEEIKSIILNYDYFEVGFYSKLSELTKKTIKELTESVLIRVEDYDSYKEDYLGKLERQKNKHGGVVNE